MIERILKMVCQFCVVMLVAMALTALTMVGINRHMERIEEMQRPPIERRR